jgi:hypothetical protein
MTSAQEEVAVEVDVPFLLRRDGKVIMFAVTDPRRAGASRR